MVEYQLIDSYVAELRGRLRWHREVDDLVAEVADHLISAAERHHARGDDLGLAQRRALGQFGDPELIELAFARSPRGGLIVPTRFTRAGGGAAIASALCWLLVPGTWWVAGALPPSGDVGRDMSGLAYAIGDIALLAAGILMLIAMVAIDQRHGGLGSRGSAGTALVGIGVVASLAAWVFIGWGLLMLVGAALFAAAMLDARVAPRWGTLLFGVGPAAGAVAWAALRAIDDSLLIYSGLWGEYWTANLAGISIGSALLAVGLLSLGRWLRGEQPAEIGTPGQALRA
jgi:hypothetical protein